VRDEAEVEGFRADAARIVSDCPKCKGSLADTACECVRKYHFEVEAFEACIPRDFWYVRTDDVTHNTKVFRRYIKPYVTRLRRAHARGYGMLLSGSNGVGKSMFMSYILANAIRKGKSAYYTTLLQLDHDLKRGFDEHEAKQRLEMMLTSDFLGLDEMTKEQFRALDKPTWMKTQVERILKQRFDESRPVIMATNASPGALSDIYGPTISSIIAGKYRTVVMEPGDVRAMLGAKMDKDMGWDDEEST
jgi:predicted AAA+ superfamily ATPase